MQNSTLNFKWTSPDGFYVTIEDYVISLKDKFGHDVTDPDTAARLYAEAMLVIRDMYSLSVIDTEDIAVKKKILDAHMKTNDSVKRRMPSYLSTSRPIVSTFDKGRQERMLSLFGEKETTTTNTETRTVVKQESLKCRSAYTGATISYMATQMCEKEILSLSEVKSAFEKSEYTVVTVGYDSSGNVMKNVLHKSGRYVLGMHCYDCRLHIDKNIVITQSVINEDGKTSGFRYSIYPLDSNKALFHCGSVSPTWVTNDILNVYDVNSGRHILYDVTFKRYVTICPDDVRYIYKSKENAVLFKVASYETPGKPGCTYNMMDRNGILISDSWFTQIDEIKTGDKVRLLCTMKNGSQTIIDPDSKRRIFDAKAGTRAVLDKRFENAADYVIFERVKDRKRILVNAKRGDITTRYMDGKEKWYSALEYPDTVNERRAKYMFKVSPESQWRSMDPKTGKRKKAKS